METNMRDLRVPKVEMATVKELVLKLRDGTATVNQASARFCDLSFVKTFVGKWLDAELPFEGHVKRYFSALTRDSGIAFHETDRYTKTLKNARVRQTPSPTPEPSSSTSLSTPLIDVAVFATRSFKVGEIINLKGGLSELSEEEDDKLRVSQGKMDFSVIWSARKSSFCLLLGPARFVNHDCRNNVEFAPSGGNMAFRVVEAIAANEELFTLYGDHYFEMNNAACLCSTCEQLKVGAFTPGPKNSPKRAGAGHQISAHRSLLDNATRITRRASTSAIPALSTPSSSRSHSRNSKSSSSMSEDKRRSERTAIVVDEFRTRKRIIHPPLTPPPGYLPDYNWDRKRKLLFEGRNLSEGGDVSVGKNKSKIITIIASTTSRLSQKVLGKRRRAHSDSEESSSTSSPRKILPLKELVLGTRSSKRSSIFMGATALERRSSFHVKTVSPKKTDHSRSSSLTSMESESDDVHEQRQEKFEEADSEAGMDVDSADLSGVSDEDGEASEVAALLSPLSRGSFSQSATAKISSQPTPISIVKTETPHIVKRSPRKTPSLYRVQAADDGDASSSSESLSDIILVSKDRRGSLASSRSNTSLAVQSTSMNRFQKVDTVEGSALNSKYPIPKAYFLPPPLSTHPALTSIPATEVSSSLPSPLTESPATLTRLKSGALSRSSIDYKILAAGSSSFREDRLETEPDGQQRDQEGRGKERSDERKGGEKESDGNRDGQMTFNGGNGAGDDEEDRKDKGKGKESKVVITEEGDVKEEEEAEEEVKQEETELNTEDVEIAALLLSLHSSDTSPLRLAPTIGDAVAGISPAMSSSSSRSHSGTTSTNDSSAHTTLSDTVASLKPVTGDSSGRYNARSTRRQSQLPIEVPNRSPQETPVPPRKAGRPRKDPSAPSTPTAPVGPLGTRSSLPIKGSLYDLIYSPEVTLVSGGWNGREFVTSRGKLSASFSREKKSSDQAGLKGTPEPSQSSPRSDAGSSSRATRSSNPIRESFREFTSSPLVVAAAGGWNGRSYSNPSKRPRDGSDPPDGLLEKSTSIPLRPSETSQSGSPRGETDPNSPKRHTRRSSPIVGDLRDVLTRPEVTSVAGGYDRETGTYFAKAAREGSSDTPTRRRLV